MKRNNHLKPEKPHNYLEARKCRLSVNQRIVEEARFYAFE